ncbi:MAG TPA: hypothetical protein VFA26_02360 [Gemmataceae bacterium]|nr:hypothetical protein [Gemmataceae bacterium]
MFGDGSLTFREFAMREPLPLATIQDAVLEFLRGRGDAVLFGAQAVNAYVDKARATEDVDVMSPRAEELAGEIRAFLNQRFHIAVRVRSVRGGIGFRVYQVRKPKNRHLVDVRLVTALPPHQRVEGVSVLTPAALAASKVMSIAGRGNTVEGMMDRADLGRLLLAFPKLKVEKGLVATCLRDLEAAEEAFAVWKEVVAQDIRAQGEDEEFRG